MSSLTATKYRALIPHRIPNHRTFMLPSLVKALCICGITMIVGCHDRVEPTGVKDYELKDGILLATFRLPLSHAAELTNQHILYFRVQYPSMKPLHANPHELKNDDISIWVEIDGGLGRTKWMIKKSLPKFDPSKPGATYYAGMEDEYEIYKLGQPNTDQEHKTIVFRAFDNEPVGLWQAPRRMKASRKLGDRLSVMYMYANELAPNHKEIDKAVSDYLTEHLLSS